MPEFYMVYVQGKQMPNNKKGTLQEAITEATRLAQKEGTEAYVLEPVRRITLTLPPVTVEELV